MAEVLPHPDKDRDFSRYVLQLPLGSISINTHGGERLSDAVALLMLEQARLIIVDQSLE